MKRFFLVLLCIAAWILLPAAAGGTGLEIVVQGDGHQSQPSQAGQILVWQDVQLNNTSAIYYLKGGQTLKVPFTGPAETPAIFGENIVFDSAAYSKGDIFLFKLGSNVPKRLTSQAEEQRNPAIWGEWVVWEDRRNGNWDIYAYNISTGQEKRLTGDGNQINPRVYQNLVVYQDDSNQNWDIVLYDLNNEKWTQITSKDRDQITPDIFGDNIVWADQRNENWDTYSFNLENLTEKRLTLDDRDQVGPRIYGNLVVWDDNRNQNWDIYGCNLAAGEGFKVFSGDGNQTSPAIWENSVVWVDDTAGNLDLYGKTLAQELPEGTQEGIKVKVNGFSLAFDQPPIMEDYRVLVPIRAIAEALGARVSWNEQAQTVGLQQGEVAVSLPIGARKALIGTKEVDLDVPAKVVNNRTLVPVRFVSEAFGEAVIWDEETQTVLIGN